ncbi:alpha/beta fold hydrolase [Mycolicibacterium moriokaense]|nr:alpha/beta fold hydrolase [Mycolicibacterium moriokaense]
MITTTFVEANGLRFEVDQCGDGPRLALFLHGFPESKAAWRLHMPALAKLGYTCWAPNMRGYGATSRPTRRRDYRLEHLLADVAGLIDAARARGIDGPVTLVAHDWGGIIAWSFVLAGIRPVERFVVMNFPHPRLFLRGLRSVRQLKKSWYMMFFQVPKLPEWLLSRKKAQGVGWMFRELVENPPEDGVVPKDVIRDYRTNGMSPGGARAMVNYYRANFFNPAAHRLWRTREKLTVPTLMIWGENDIALSKELTVGTERLVDDFTVRYLPGVSHWVQQQAPHTVSAMLTAWLSGSEVPYAEPR